MKFWLLSLSFVTVTLGVGYPLLAQRQCDAAYPGVCIPSPPPDLDCGEISHRNFQVLSPDPHRFDGDKDGIGCEQ
jgi:micrococcal nuclease